jgi:SpoIID/LytB domain protein
VPAGRRFVALASAAAITAAFVALGPVRVRFAGAGDAIVTQRSAHVTSAGSGSATPHLFPSTQVDLFGHGFGPAIGMGQWGDFGYAEQYHEPYTWIVSHFYGRTTAGKLGDPTITVAITENDGAPLEVTSLSTFKVDGRPFTARSAARMVPIAGGGFKVVAGSGCGATTWKTVIASARSPEAGPVNSAPSAPASQVLELCRVDGVHEAVRGDLRAVWSGGTEHTVNVLPMDEYLIGVVPTEISYAWGTFGSPGPQGEPWGFQSLEAQAVASRTYAAAYYRADGGWAGYADVCDSADCQAYEGLKNENPLSDKAVTDTSGVIRVLSGTNIPATAQFSASTGGYTSGIAFPAVPDAGDAVCLRSQDFTCNPSHDWTLSIPVTRIETTFPSIGQLITLYVTSRNGLGDLGGRVLSLHIEGTKGSVNVTGDGFAADFGLLSNWFAITNAGGSGGGLRGYWLTTSAGQVSPFGAAPHDGSVIRPPPSPIVGMAAAPHGTGYWLVDATGDLFPFGKAGRHGSLSGRVLHKPIVGMAATMDGGGYWLVASDGGIFAFGDAVFYGSMGNKHLNKPIVGMGAAPGGEGYWLVASDGGIFTFGKARFYGSTGSEHLKRPIIGMAAAPDGLGYWLVASDGGVFAFSDARFWGSLGGSSNTTPAVSLLPTIDGKGYDIITKGGVVFAFGDAPLFGNGVASTAAVAGDP